MVPQPEQVIGPTEDTASFMQPRGMVYVTMLWVIAAAWAFCVGLYVAVRFATGNPPTPADLPVLLESLVVVPAVAATVAILVAWRRLGWLHSSMHGLEFAATGRRAVALPWSAVATVGLRRRGVFTELVITPDPHAEVRVLPGPGRRPRMRGASYLLDVGLMSPGPDVLLAELHRRMPSKV